MATNVSLSSPHAGAGAGAGVEDPPVITPDCEDGGFWYSPGPGLAREYVPLEGLSAEEIQEEFDSGAFAILMDRGQIYMCFIFDRSTAHGQVRYLAEDGKYSTHIDGEEVGEFPMEGLSAAEVYNRIREQELEYEAPGQTWNIGRYSVCIQPSDGSARCIVSFRLDQAVVADQTIPFLTDNDQPIPKADLLRKFQEELSLLINDDGTIAPCEKYEHESGYVNLLKKVGTEEYFWEFNDKEQKKAHQFPATQFRDDPDRRTKLLGIPLALLLKGSTTQSLLDPFLKIKTHFCAVTLLCTCLNGSRFLGPIKYLLRIPENWYGHAVLALEGLGRDGFPYIRFFDLLPDRRPGNFGNIRISEDLLELNKVNGTSDTWLREASSGQRLERAVRTEQALAGTSEEFLRFSDQGIAFDRFSLREFDAFDKLQAYWDSLPTDLGLPPLPKIQDGPSRNVDVEAKAGRFQVRYKRGKLVRKGNICTGHYTARPAKWTLFIDAVNCIAWAKLKLLYADVVLRERQNLVYTGTREYTVNSSPKLLMAGKGNEQVRIRLGSGLPGDRGSDCTIDLTNAIQRRVGITNWVPKGTATGDPFTYLGLWQSWTLSPKSVADLAQWNAASFNNTVNQRIKVEIIVRGVKRKINLTSYFRGRIKDLVWRGYVR